MKYAVLAFLAALASPGFAGATDSHAHHAGSTMGVHGMALFGGKDGLFASHLPLFRAPHDRRLLVELKIDDPALDRQMRAELAARPRLWTIDPEPFELARLSAGTPHPLRAFRADLVEGHFERDGRVVHKNVRLNVVRIIEDRALDGAASPRAIATYRVVGHGRSRFLVKEVDARPDFDHIVVLAPGSQAPTATVTVPRKGVEAPSLATLSAAAGVKAVATVYYDTADLK